MIREVTYLEIHNIINNCFKFHIVLNLVETIKGKIIIKILFFCSNDVFGNLKLEITFIVK